MKKVIYLGATTLLLTFSACQKNQVTPNSLGTATTIYEDDNSDGANQRASNLYHLVQNFPDFGDINCFKPAENCLPTFIVRSKVASQNASKQSLIALKNAMIASNSGNGQQISNFFSSQEWRKIFPRLRGEIAQKIATGDYKIISKMATQTPGVEIFVVLQSNADPINFINSEVVIAMQIKDETI
jgi:hypothetical protein